jgi:hypothetical protein
MSEGRVTARSQAQISTRLYPSDNFPLQCQSVETVVKMGDFQFDNDLLISLVGARPVLWDKTEDIYKDRIETRRAWREVCICLQEDFKALSDVKKNAFSEYCHNLLNTAD